LIQSKRSVEILYFKKLCLLKLRTLIDNDHFADVFQSFFVDESVVDRIIIDKNMSKAAIFLLYVVVTK
jgi:hypothetical protein